MLNLIYFIPEPYDDTMSKSNGTFLRRDISRVECDESGNGIIVSHGTRYLIDMSYERLKRKIQKNK